MVEQSRSNNTSDINTIISITKDAENIEDPSVEGPKIGDLHQSKALNPKNFDYKSSEDNLKSTPHSTKENSAEQSMLCFSDGDFDHSTKINHQRNLKS